MELDGIPLRQLLRVPVSMGILIRVRAKFLRRVRAGTCAGVGKQVIYALTNSPEPEAISSEASCCAGESLHDFVI